MVLLMQLNKLRWVTSCRWCTTAGGILQAGMEYDKDMFQTGGKLEGELSHTTNPITMTTKKVR